MKASSKFKIFGLTMMLLVFVSNAQAKDVSAQQAGVEYARHELETAQTIYNSDLKDVKESEALLAQRKKEYEQQIRQLANDRKKAELSRQHLQESNIKFNKAQAILDQAWKQ